MIVTLLGSNSTLLLLLYWIVTVLYDKEFDSVLYITVATLWAGHCFSP